MKENVVPGSDCAGEIVAIGSDVKGWKKGDRVCVNFSTGFLFGHPSSEKSSTALGGPSDGVLVEYRTFPASVSFLFFGLCLWGYARELMLYMLLGPRACARAPFL